MLAVPTRVWPQPPWQVFLLNGVGSRASGLGSPGRLTVRKGTVLAYDLGPRHRTHLNCTVVGGPRAQCRRFGSPGFTQMASGGVSAGLPPGRHGLGFSPAAVLSSFL